MKKIKVTSLLLFGLLVIQINAQTTSTSDYLTAQPAAHRAVFFDPTDNGVAKPMIWGMDAGGWTNYGIWGQATRYLGAENIKITRVPAFPGDQLVNGQLTQGQKNAIKDRLDQVGVTGQKVQVMLNPGGGDEWDAWYRADYSRYALLMKLAKEYIESFGHTVVSITGHNEPEVWYAPATQEMNFKLFQACKNSGYFDNTMRYCGGNTLNPDFAFDWYNNAIPAGANEGNTHQLAGSFDGYAGFYQAVKANNHYATNDEVHNIMEAIVGSEYGLQAGIYWGYASLARGEFVKASTNGTRLGYAEHRPFWSGAAVYKTNGKIQGFVGGSERQATTTRFNFVSKDKVAYFDGEGPMKGYVMELPGGNGYGIEQPNAERVINITYGEDVQPAVSPGKRYVLVNRKSGKVLQVSGNTSLDGANVTQGTYTGLTSQQWDISSSVKWGDYSYLHLKPASNGTKSLDLNNGSWDNGANILQWNAGIAGNQQWYIEYIEDGWFYVRNRESTYCIIGKDNDDVVQWEKNGDFNQQWRFVATDAVIDFVAPSAPTNLVATAQISSIKLHWTASSDSDVKGYKVFRAESSGGEYNTIARNVKTTSFVDNTALEGKQYFYKIKAVDGTLNHSAYSNEFFATTTAANGLVAQLKFDSNTLDSSANLNHGASNETVTYVNDIIGSKAIDLEGTNFVQLPEDAVNHQEITIAAWVYWDGTTAGNQQRIFDFGNSEDQYMFLSPNGNGSGKMRFAITMDNWPNEQFLEVPQLESKLWKHVTVTLGASGARIYVNGVLLGENAGVTLSPKDLSPIKNYIGKSQWSNDALFDGKIDDFRIYNYELTAGEIAIISAFPNNEVPVAVKDNVVISQGKTATTLVGGETSVLDNDTDKEGTELTAILVSNPANGTLTFNSDGTFKYVHNGYTTDADSFTYKVHDGIQEGNTVTVNITVTPFEVSSTNFTIETRSESCPDADNGQIIINAVQSYTYTAIINGTNYNFTNKNLTVSNLAPGTYDICIGITGKVFEQCFNVNIDPAAAITAKTVATSDKLQIEIQSGTAPYQVSVNGAYQFETNDSDFDVAVNPGDLLEVTTAKACEGVLSKQITLYDVVTASPNPTTGEFDIYSPTNDSSVAIAIYTAEGKLVSNSNYVIENGKVHLNIANEAAGVYLVRVESNPVETIKIIKK